MLIACTVGLPIAMLIGANTRGAGALYGLLSAVRAIPDLTLAILCVVIVGIGPAAGMVALAIFYAAMIGKVFADLFLAADWRPIEALRTTATPLVGRREEMRLPAAASHFGCVRTAVDFAARMTQRRALRVGFAGRGARPARGIDAT